MFDFIDRVQELSSRASSLDKLNKLIDFEVFRPKLLEILDYGQHEKVGRPPWEAVLMLKVLIIQRYYDLSEEETELQILDRFSFQRFWDYRLEMRCPTKHHLGLQATPGT